MLFFVNLINKIVLYEVSFYENFSHTTKNDR